MGAATPMILRVETPVYGQVAIEATDGMRYTADLSSFAGVHCYPKDKAAWDRVTPDSCGLALVWTSRFEVQADQVIALAHDAKIVERTA